MYICQLATLIYIKGRGTLLVMLYKENTKILGHLSLSPHYPNFNPFVFLDRFSMWMKFSRMGHGIGGYLPISLCNF